MQTTLVKNEPFNGIGTLKVVGIGPAPYCAMLMEDMGAEGFPPAVIQELEREQRDDRAARPEMRSALANTIKSRARDECATVLKNAGICLSPVLSLSDTVNDPHDMAREIFVQKRDVCQPAPTGRFLRMPGASQGASQLPCGEIVAALIGRSVDSKRVLDIFLGRIIHEEPVLDCSSAKRAMNEN